MRAQEVELTSCMSSKFPVYEWSQMYKSEYGSILLRDGNAVLRYVFYLKLALFHEVGGLAVLPINAHWRFLHATRLVRAGNRQHRR